MAARRVVFVTSNGAGIGHLTRCMAMARRLPEDITPVVLTLSEAVGLAASEGFLTEYFPAPTGDPFGDGRRLWDRRLADRLAHVLETYDPAVVVFDGTRPYAGFVRMAWRSPDRAFVWSRRAMWKPGTGDANFVNAPAFRLILEPGDWAQDADRGPTVAREDAIRLPPVLLLDDEALLDRADARRELGLDPERLNVLVSLGAGRVNDTQDLTRACVTALADDPRVQVCLARSAIAGSWPEVAGVVAVDRYPLIRYMRAFDAAVVASGYNSFHEVIQARVPSLQVPNLETQVDDQTARAAEAAARGVALAWTPDEGGPIADAVRALLDDAVRAPMAERLAATEVGNGARVAARHLADLVEAA